MRSKFKRSTQKSRYMSTQNDYVFKVYIEDRALQYLGQQKAFYFKELCVDLKVIVILCWPTAQSSISTKTHWSKTLVDLIKGSTPKNRPRHICASRYTVRRTGRETLD